MLEVLESAKLIAVVGLSSDESRPSHSIAKYLISNGYEVVGINPKETEILGRPCYKTLSEVGRPIDIVDVFRKPEAVPEIVEECLKLKPKCIWLQEGVAHHESEDHARKAGIAVVSDHCILKAHRALLG